jgi:hypothetical protein
VHSQPFGGAIVIGFYFWIPMPRDRIERLQRRQNAVGAIRLRNTLTANRNSSPPQNGPSLFKLTPP